MGAQKADQYGAVFTGEIARYCSANGVAADVPIAEEAAPVVTIEALTAAGKSASKLAADTLFREGKSVDEVVRQTGRAHSTVTEYLAEFLAEQGHLTPEPWLDMATFSKISAAAKEVGLERLKPIFDQLNGEIGYDQVRIAVACLKNA